MITPGNHLPGFSFWCHVIFPRIACAKKEKDFSNLEQNSSGLQIEFHVDRAPAHGNMRALILN
jgi:hypothetical protein